MYLQVEGQVKLVMLIFILAFGKVMRNVKIDPLNNSSIYEGFPILGIYAEPIKGSVLMWHNLKKNGLGPDMRTWHGGSLHK